MPARLGSCSSPARAARVITKPSRGDPAKHVRGNFVPKVRSNTFHSTLRACIGESRFGPTCTHVQRPLPYIRPFLSARDVFDGTAAKQPPYCNGQKYWQSDARPHEPPGTAVVLRLAASLMDADEAPSYRSDVSERGTSRSSAHRDSRWGFAKATARSDVGWDQYWADATQATCVQ